MKRAAKSPIELDKPYETAGIPAGAGGSGRAASSRHAEHHAVRGAMQESPSSESASPSAPTSPRSWVERVGDSEWSGNQGPREHGRLQWQEQIRDAAEQDSISRIAAPMLAIGAAGSGEALASPEAVSGPASAMPQSILLDADTLASFAAEPSLEIGIGDIGGAGDGGDGGE